jgi:ATP-dependent RNA helicase DHX36
VSFWCRYSASTVDVLQMMDDDKVDLNLIAALIRYIVLEEEVSFLVFLQVILNFIMHQTKQ